MEGLWDLLIYLFFNKKEGKKERDNGDGAAGDGRGERVTKSGFC